MHQNLDYPENFWCTFGIGGAIAPIAPPTATRLESDHLLYRYRNKKMN